MFVYIIVEEQTDRSTGHCIFSFRYLYQFLWNYQKKVMGSREPQAEDSIIHQRADQDAQLGPRHGPAENYASGRPRHGPKI
jgi:hypothetical protein